MEMEIQSLLEKFVDINDSMGKNWQDTRDILCEFTQEFRRIKGNINSMREHAELLSSDISEYKASRSMSPKFNRCVKELLYMNAYLIVPDPFAAVSWAVGLTDHLPPKPEDTVALDNGNADVGGQDRLHGAIHSRIKLKYLAPRPDSSISGDLSLLLFCV